MNARKRCMWRQRGKKGKVNVTKHLNGNVHWNAIVLTRVCSETHAACICFPHHQHQRSCTRRKLIFRLFLQDPLEACFVVLSDGESCSVQAKIHHSDFQNLFCSRPSRGRSQPSHPVSSGSLSTHHRLGFDHNTHQMDQHCRG